MLMSSREMAAVAIDFDAAQAAMIAGTRISVEFIVSFRARNERRVFGDSLRLALDV